MWDRMTARQTRAPSADDIERLAQAAVERLPERFRRHLADVLLRVEDFPDADVIEAMDLETEWDILGLYQGVPLSEKSSMASGAMPDIIFLYRRPMLDYWADTGESLEALVTHVLVHEVGHHFGLSDADMERIEAEAAV
jgi:predicted Zn-dependent protease with MMP-like domain